jgi:hypothetical protein
MLYSQVATFKFTLLIDNNSKGNLELEASGGGLINITTETETIVAKNFNIIILGNTSFFKFSTRENFSLEIYGFNRNPLYRLTINENGYNETSHCIDPSLKIRMKEGTLGSNIIMLLDFSYSSVGKHNWFRRIILKIKDFPKYLDENLEVEMDRLADKTYIFFLGIALQFIYNRVFNRNNRNRNNRN